MGSHGICLRTDEMAGQWVLIMSVCVRCNDVLVDRKDALPG